MHEWNLRNLGLTLPLEEKVRTEIYSFVFIYVYIYTYIKMKNYYECGHFQLSLKLEDS